MAENNQQYKWRQRKKRNARITIWIILVIILAAGGTFAYEGLKDSDPQNVAERYIRETVGVEEYQVEAGDRALTPENQFTQDYTFTYTADGRESRTRVNLIQSNEKKYGIFDQWTAQEAPAEQIDLDLIAPAGSQVLVDGVSPQEMADENLSPGAVRYHLEGVNAAAALRIAGLPFEQYEGTLEGAGQELDMRDVLQVSENAKVQMEEIGKSMIRELYTAAVNGDDQSDLGEDFSQISNKDFLLKTVRADIFRSDALTLSDMSCEKFVPTFGDIYYPGKDEESFVGIEMKLSYQCSCTAVPEEDQETGEEETQSGEEAEKPQSSTKEAVFYFQYRDGACTVTSAQIPSPI